MQLLLRNDDLDLKKTIKICQSYEQVNNQADEMNRENQSSVHKVSEHQNPRSRKSTNKLPHKKHHKLQRKCANFFGNKHVYKKELCPAWGNTCKTWHGRNHFSVKCKKVNMVESNLYDESSDEELCCELSEL